MPDLGMIFLTVGISATAVSIALARWVNWSAAKQNPTVVKAWVHNTTGVDPNHWWPDA